MSAVGALALVTVLTRSLTASAYAMYAAVFATYAFGNALVATTMGTRVMEALSTGSATQAELMVRRDLPPVVAVVLAAGGIAVVIGADAVTAAWAAAGMVSFILAEIGYSYILGQRRYWLFCAVVCARTTLWVAATLAIVLSVGQGDRLAGALAAGLVGTVVPIVYLVLQRGISVKRGHLRGYGGMVSGVGVANLALWLLASSDRVILAHFALAAAATYAALYGLLDRVFRGIANADVQLRLPLAFARRAEGEDGEGWSRANALWLLALGCLCAVVGPLIVTAASGGRYHPPIAMSITLSAGMVAMLAAIPAFVTLIAVGRAAQAAKVAVLAAAVNIGGNLLLVPHFGSGAAAALTLVGYLIWLVGTAALLRRGTTRPHSGQADGDLGDKQMTEELLEAQL